jgi:hypothetical protein
MNAPVDNNSPTTLSDQQFEECMGVALNFLKSNPTIRNRDIRALASIGYDQAIHFFNRAIAENHLVREGSGSGTRYILPAKKAEKR